MMDENQFAQGQPDVAILQLVSFKFADEEYALEIAHIQEVIHVQKITYVPQMPDFSLGVINIRGNIVPVFDLRRKFGLREKAFDEKSKMIVAGVDGTQICFVVDEMLDHIKIDLASLAPAPAAKMKVKRECIAGIGRLEERMIIILDLAKIHESILEDIQGLVSREKVQP